MNTRRLCIWLTGLFLLAMVQALAARAVAQTAPADKARFIILTGTQFGFQEGGKTYLAGMKADEFRGKFGEPDKTTEHALYYTEAGLDVPLAGGRCTKFVFHAVPETYEDEDLIFDAASVATDSGVRAGMTYDEVIKAAGAPLQKVNSGDFLIAAYPWGAVFFQNSHIHLLVSAEADVKSQRKAPAATAAAASVPAEQVRSKVIETIAKQKDIQPSRITRDSDLAKDLKLDDLDKTELLMSLEEAFHISITDEQAAKLLTVGQLIDYVRSQYKP